MYQSIQIMYASFMNFVDLHYILYKMYVKSISFAIFEYQRMVKTKQTKNYNEGKNLLISTSLTSLSRSRIL